MLTYNALTSTAKQPRPNISNVMSNIGHTKNSDDVIKLLKDNHCLKLAINILHTEYFDFGEVYSYIKKIRPHHHIKYIFVSKYPQSTKSIQQTISCALFDKMYDLIHSANMPDTMIYGTPKVFDNDSTGTAPMIIGYSMFHYGFRWLAEKIIKKSTKGFLFKKPTIKIEYGNLNGVKYPYFAHMDKTPVKYTDISNQIEDIFFDKYNV